MTEFERNLLNRLVQDRVITEDIALAAEQVQIEKGGRIDTNLLDIRAVDEDTILKYLEMVSKLRVVSIDKIENIPKDVIALFPARLAIRYRLIPFAIEHNAIFLIINDPTDIALLEEISFLLGMDVKPFIAPDLWIEHLLCKHYKIEPNKRYEELYALIRNRGFELKNTDKIKEEVATLRTDSKSGVLKGGEQVSSHNEKGEERKIDSDVKVWEIDTDISKPYTYSREEALEDIKGVRNRDAIMFYAIKYAYQYFDFCAILIFQKDKVRGFSYLGSDAGIEEDFKSLDLNLNGDIIFKIVRDTGAHFLGVMPLSGENELFIKKLKRPFPPNVLVVPISIAGKVIGAFYADNGEALVRGEDVPHILTFFHIVSYQLQELIRYLKFNKPPFQVVFKSKRREISQITQGESVPVSANVRTVNVAQPPVVSGEAEKVGDNVSVSFPDNRPALSSTLVSNELQSPLSEEMVNELSQYVEDSYVHQEKPVEVPKREEREEKASEEKTAPKEEALKKEEEYRINLLLDTLEQSPNAINSIAYDQLIVEKEKALPYIIKRFPGRLKVDMLMQSSHDIADVEEHSNLIQLIVGIGKEAIPYITPLIKHPNHTIRFYAVFIFSKMRYQEAIPYLLDAIFDSSPKISLVAIEVLNRYRDFPKFSIVLSRLRSELVSNDNEKVRIAALSLGQFKDVESVPQLIKLLSSRSEEVREAALNSLRDICKDDLGYNQKEWNKWWQRHQKIPRVLWMIDGLSHKDENIRYLSIEELRDLTGEFFGYFYDAPRKERDKSIERWKEWWRQEGEKRFLKERK